MMWLKSTCAENILKRALAALAGRAAGMWRARRDRLRMFLPHLHSALFNLRHQFTPSIYAMKEQRRRKRRLATLVKRPVLCQFSRSLDFYHHVVHVSGVGIGHVGGIQKVKIDLIALWIERCSLHAR